MNVTLLQQEISAINEDRIIKEKDSPKIANIAIQKIHLEYAKLKQEIKSLETKADLYKKSLMDYMDDHEYLYSKEGEQLHSCKTYYKKNFDKKTCQILYPDVYEKLTSTTTYRKFI